MSWILADITLPQGPEHTEKRTIHNLQQNPILAFLPIPLDNGPSEFHLFIRGTTWGIEHVKQLDELAKNGKETIITIRDPTGVFTGNYNIQSGSVFQTAEKFTTEGGIEVFDYEFNFARFGDTMKESNLGDKAGDEDGVGDLFDPDFEPLFIGEVQN